MEVKLNDQTINYTPELPITWADFLSYMLRNHIDKTHGITQILVDGIDSIEVMTETPLKLLSKEINLIEIHSSDSKSIAKTGFDKILQIIVRLKSEADKTADLYREDNIKEASQSLLKIINAITPIIYFVNSIEKNFKLNLSELNFSENITIKEKLTYFSNSFEELVNAQEKSDFIEIADYIEYQFTDDLNDWEKLVNLLMKEIENISGSSN